MPHVSGYYGEVPNRLGPQFYTAIVAGAAGGKGAVRQARELTSKVDAHIRERYEHELERWKQGREAAEMAKEPFTEPRPPERSLMLPANTSAAFFHRGLADRDERALVIETEVDTLTNAMGQEWGQFDDTLRKAYHHEPVSYGRKAEGTVALRGPHIACVLSGTPGQFTRLMGSTENGLYSRFATFAFDTVDAWRSQQPHREAIEKAERFAGVYADEVMSLFLELQGRPEAIRFKMTNEAWAEHTQTFSAALRRAQLEGKGHMADVLKRAGVVAFRAAMILSVLRLHAAGVDLSRVDTIEADLVDVRTALQLATTYAEHSIAFADRHLEVAQPPDPVTVRIAAMLKGVGVSFSSSEAYDAARQAGIDVSDRTLRKDLKEAEKRGLIESLTARGDWRKIGQASNGAASVASAASVVSSSNV